MMTFKEFVDRPMKKYVAVQYDNDTQNRMRKWATENGFDLTKSFDGSDQDAKDFDFHTTIFFTTTEHSIPNHTKTIAPSGSAKAVGIEFLGINHDVPVLKIQSTMILRLRKHYAETYGMKDQWPEYKPHVSLSYNREQLPDLSSIALPTFELTFNQIKVDDAKDL